MVGPLWGQPWPSYVSLGDQTPKCETLQPRPLVWGGGGVTPSHLPILPSGPPPQNDGFRGLAHTGPEFPDPMGSRGQQGPRSMGKGVRKATPGPAVSVVGLLGPSGGLQQRRQLWRHGGAGRALGPGWRARDTGACAGANPGATVSQPPATRTRVSGAAEKAPYNNNGWELSRDGRKYVRRKGENSPRGAGPGGAGGPVGGQGPHGPACTLLGPSPSSPNSLKFAQNLSSSGFSGPLHPKALVTVTSAPAPSGRDIRSEANPRLEPSCSCPVPRAQHPVSPVPRRAGGQEQEGWPASWTRQSPRDGAQRHRGH